MSASLTRATTADGRGGAVTPPSGHTRKYCSGFGQMSSLITSPMSSAPASVVSVNQLKNDSCVSSWDRLRMPSPLPFDAFADRSCQRPPTRRYNRKRSRPAIGPLTEHALRPVPKTPTHPFLKRTSAREPQRERASSIQTRSTSALGSVRAGRRHGRVVACTAATPTGPGSIPSRGTRLLTEAGAC